MLATRAETGKGDDIINDITSAHSLLTLLKGATITALEFPDRSKVCKWGHGGTWYARDQKGDQLTKLDDEKRKVIASFETWELAAAALEKIGQGPASVKKDGA